MVRLKGMGAWYGREGWRGNRRPIAAVEVAFPAGQRTSRVAGGFGVSLPRSET
jgi:hypothetical protein